MAGGRAGGLGARGTPRASDQIEDENATLGNVLLVPARRVDICLGMIEVDRQLEARALEFLPPIPLLLLATTNLLDDERREHFVSRFPAAAVRLAN